MSTTTYDSRDRAFERLYRRYARDVYRFVLAVVRNPAEAEDVTQTAFLNAYRAFKKGERPERPHSWLLAIAHNTIRSRYRRALRRPREVPLDEAVQELAVPESEQTNVVEVLEALGELPVNQREALAMRELEGRSYTEIAEMLGVTVPAVESLIARARRNLRRRRLSLRGLSAVGLPRSLWTLFEQGDPGGTGLAGKAAALVAAAGIVAGGVGVATHVAGAAQHDGSDTLEPSRPQLVLPALSLPVAEPAHRAARAHRVAARHARTPTPAVRPAAPIRPATSGAAPAALVPHVAVGAPAHPAAPAAQPATTAPTMATPAPAGPAGTGDVAALTVAVPTATVPVPAATVQVPAPPALPVAPPSPLPPPPAVTGPGVTVTVTVPAPSAPGVPQVPGPSGIK